MGNHFVLAITKMDLVKYQSDSAILSEYQTMIQNLNDYVDFPFSTLFIFDREKEKETKEQILNYLEII